MEPTIPNLLTVFRIVAVPVIIAIYMLDYQYGHWYCAILFTLAGISDGLDGYLARKWNQTSSVGAFLDPVADKLLVVLLLVLVVSDPQVTQAVVLPVVFKLAVIVIVAREIIISALRQWMAEIGQHAAVAVSGFGKWKTTAQMIAIGALLFQKPLLGLPTMLIGELLIYVAAAITIWSMVLYLLAASKAVEVEVK